MQTEATSPCVPFFTTFRASVFLAVADGIIPGEGLHAPGPSSEAILRTAEAFMADQDESTRRKLGMLLRGFEWAAALRFGTRFTRLPALRREIYLRAWEFSRLQLSRFAFSSLRNLVLISFYTQPRSWPAIAYPGPVLETKTDQP